MPTVDRISTIYKEYSHMVSSLAFRMISNDETAKDAAQAVWIEIMKSLDSFQEKSKISTWIYTIAYRTILNYAKSEKQYSSEFLVGIFQGETLVNETDESDVDWVKSQCDNCLTGILHCIDNETRMIYILRDIADLDFSDIAQITGKRESNVRKIISRTRRKLQKFLTKQCALYNPNSIYKCRMNCHVEDVDLRSEYKKIEKVVQISRFFKTSDRVLPAKDYWLELL